VFVLFTEARYVEYYALVMMSYGNGNFGTIAEVFAGTVDVGKLILIALS